MVDRAGSFAGIVGVLLALGPLGCMAHSSETGDDDGVGTGAESLCPPVGAEEFPNVRAWASEVALGSEFGDMTKVVRRFVGPVTISMMEGSELQRAVLAQVTRTLSDVLAGSGTTVTLAENGTRSAQVLVWFRPYASFGEVAAAEGFEVYPGNSGQFSTFFDANFAMKKAYVLLASDHLSGRSLRHFTYEEVTQSFGIASDSPRLRDSIFFADGKDGGMAQTLSCSDRELLRVLYTHVNPGDDAAVFSTAVDLYFDHER